MDRILERFGEVQEEYEHLGGYTLEAQAPNRVALSQSATVTAGTPTTANFTFLP